MSDESSKLPQEEEELLDLFNTGGGKGLSREAALARLQALQAEKLSRDLQNLTNSVHSAKQTLGQRINELNTQIGAVQAELKTSSDSADKHSRSLVRWTKGSVIVTLAYVLLTGGLLWIAKQQVDVAALSLQSQAEPELLVEVVTTMEKGTRLIVKNEGTYPVVDLWVDTDIVTFLGPPLNSKVSELGRRTETAGSPWWTIDKLDPRETQTQPLEEIGQEALKHDQMMETWKTRGELSGVSPKDSLDIIAAIQFRMVAHRGADRKRYQKEVWTIVLADTNTGKPHFIDPRHSPYPFLKEILLHR